MANEIAMCNRNKLLLWLLVQLVIFCQGNGCNNDTKCFQTTDSEGRINFNCNGVCISNSLSINAPLKTKVLLMRDSGLKAITPLQLNELEVFDAANNQIKYLTNNSFKNISTLLELDLRCNNIDWNSSSIRNVFSDLTRLKILKLSGPFANSATLCSIIACPMSVMELHIENDNIENVLLIAAEFTNVTKMKVYCNTSSGADVQLKGNHSLLLQRLTKLEILSMIKCKINDVSTNFFKNAARLSILNLACNSFEIPQVIHKLGRDDGLSKLDTLVLDKNLNTNPVIYLTKNLSGLSFSFSLRRISLQGIAPIIYDPFFWYGASNLSSVAFGNNLLIHCVPTKACESLRWGLITMQYIQHVKLNFLNDINPQYPICDMPDTTVDEIFEDTTALPKTTYSSCVVLLKRNKELNQCYWDCYAKTGRQKLFVVFPYCLRTLNIDHLVNSRWYGNRIDYWLCVCGNNIIEEIIASNIVMARDGWSFRNMTVSGLHKFRKLDLHSSGLKYFEQISFDNSSQLEFLDLSQNFFADMNVTVLQSCFGNSFPALKLLNLSHCYLKQLPSTFLANFPTLNIMI